MIGDFEVLRPLATGGMGQVYLARQHGAIALGRLAVLKRLHPAMLGEPDSIAMFINEARIAASLSHPNIVHTYDLIEDGGGFVIAMEHVRGATVLALLRQLSRAGQPGIPLGPMVRIAASVCDALAYAYFEPDADGQARHIIHRDVTPSNVLIGFDGQVKLFDFGIAKALEAEALTRVQMIKGKYGYMSPEQIQAGPIDHRADLFAVGVMMWEMIVGARLFKRETDLATMYALMSDPIRPPSAYVVGVPPELDRLVMWCLERDRASRCADAGQLASALRALAREQRWDCEAAALSRLLRDVIPDDGLTPSRSAGAGSVSASLRRTGTAAAASPALARGSTPIPAQRRAPLLAAAPAVRAPAPPAPPAPGRADSVDAALAESRQAASDGASAAAWVVLMLTLSAVFWLLIAPSL